MKKKVKDNNLLKNFMQPVIPKFKLKDILQIIIGATVLAIPVGFTQETWDLGATLPMANILGIVAITLTFISLFTYYHYHRQSGKDYIGEFAKRVVFTYILSFGVVAILLTLIQQAPWEISPETAFGRVAIVTLPSAMSAVITDTLK